MVCTCTNNTEACRVFSDMGTCRPSNISMCRACQTCLTRTLSQVVLPSQNASTDAWFGRLNGTCSNMTRTMSELVDPSRCASMLSLAQQQGDLRYRAGGLCSAMGACDTSGLGTCMLNVSSTLRFTPGPLLSGALDTCSVEGVAGGALPPGVVGAVGELIIHSRALCMGASLLLIMSCCWC
jgi:hypothetical protein